MSAALPSSAVRRHHHPMPKSVAVPSTPAPRVRRKKKARTKSPPARKVPKLPAEFQSLPIKVTRTLQECLPKERAFVLAYAGRAKGNATLAAQIAGMGNTYSANASQASTALRTPHIRAALDAWLEAFAMSAAQLTAGIADLAQANVGPFLSYDAATQQLTVKVPDAETWDSHKHWVKSIRADEKTGLVTHLEVHDALAARRELAKIYKLYSDAPIFAFHLHLQQMSDDDLLQQLADAQAQVAGEVMRHGSARALPSGEVMGG